MKRKIAMISDHSSSLAGLGSVESRGQDVHVAQIIRNLACLGYQVDVFITDDGKELSEVCDWMENVRAIPIPEDLSRAHTPQDFADYMIAFFNRQERPYNLIHANGWVSGMVAAEIKAALGTPFVITVPALDRVHQQQKSGGEFSDTCFEIEDRILREADGIITQSSDDWGELISHYHADPTHMIQMPDAMDTLATLYENILAVRRVAIVDNVIGLMAEDQYDSQFAVAPRGFEVEMQVVQETRERLGGRILEAANLMIDCLDDGGRILVCGDGSRVVQAWGFQEAFTEDVMSLESAGVSVRSLTEDHASVTNWLNRIGDESMISRELETLGRSGDLLIGISPGQGSARLKDAFQSARKNHIHCLSLLGMDDGEIQTLSDVALVIPGSNTQHIHEMQMAILHLLCELLAEHVHGNQPVPAGHGSEFLFDLNRMKILAE